MAKKHKLAIAALAGLVTLGSMAATNAIAEDKAADADKTETNGCNHGNSCEGKDKEEAK